jgi:hypothetical protein
MTCTFFHLACRLKPKPNELFQLCACARGTTNARRQRDTAPGAIPTKQFRKKTSPEYVATPRWEERRERARDASRRGAQLHMGHVLLVAAAWGPDRHIPRHVAAGCGYVAAARAHTDTIHLGVPRSRPRRPLLPLSARTPTFFY